MPVIFVDEYGTAWDSNKKANNNARDIFAIIGVYFADRDAYSLAEKSFFELKNKFFSPKTLPRTTKKCGKESTLFTHFKMRARRALFITSLLSVPLNGTTTSS
jgi:hypothetical protein